MRHASSTAVVEPADGIVIDSGWYRAVTDFARATSWLAEPVILFTEYGVFLLGVAVAAMAWWSRRRGSAVQAAVLWVPVAVVAAYAIDSVIKGVVAEQRPCRVVPAVTTLLPCDGPTDYAFPSNHTVIVSAFAVAVFLVHRRWGVFAAVFALLMAASRVYVGAHYPHDVLAGFVVGGLIGACGVFVRKPMTSLLDGIARRRHPHEEKIPLDSFRR
ncbi:MAG: hypothetical protein QOI21_1796 [Actinomycetota bacterium]|nr:hypothetical protein [Actinomycetota bacterium]